jgi:hypothetical protein
MDIHPALDHGVWQTLKGGYKIPYDASVPLRQLEGATSAEQMKPIFRELWNKLHHQGDVGVASYLALPHLVRIAKEKSLTDWNALALCAAIEQQRILGDNPALPSEFSAFYAQGLEELKSLALSILAHSMLDDETFRSASSAVATATGRVKLGKVILDLDSATLDEFLEQF